MARHNNRLILVSGATGRQGGAVLRALRDKGYPVCALVRNPDRPEAHALVGHGTEILRGDLNDMPSLMRAVEGVYGAYGVTSRKDGGVEGEIQQGKNLIDAAKRSRVSHFVLSSVAAADQRTGIPHFESKFLIEEHLRSSGVKYTIFRPVFFMENWLGMRQTIEEEGTLTLPLNPDTRMPMIAVHDIGAFVGIAFDHPGNWHGRIVQIAGDELAMTEIAESLGRLAGREVKYVQVSWEDYEAKAGREIALMYRWFQQHGFPVDIGALRQEHPGLMTFERWLQANWRPKVQHAG
jgi:uncharacterized protein YbjT (DUF2867 family)